MSSFLTLSKFLLTNFEVFVVKTYVSIIGNTSFALCEAFGRYDQEKGISSRVPAEFCATLSKSVTTSLWRKMRGGRLADDMVKKCVLWEREEEVEVCCEVKKK